MKKATALLLLMAFVFSCQKQKSGKEDDFITCLRSDGNLSLALNNCTESDSLGKASGICFEQLNDTRCPTNVNCVHAGAAMATFSFNANSTLHRFSLYTPNGKDTLIAGYRFKLIDITPYPGTGSTDPIRATLHISR